MEENDDDAFSWKTEEVIARIFFTPSLSLQPLPPPPHFEKQNKHQF
jgi:hypothetical protein